MRARRHPRLPARRRAGLLATCLASLALLLPASAHAAQPGVVLPNPGDAATQARIAASGARHVRVFTSWKMLEPQRGQFAANILAGYDDLANRLKAAGIPLYLVVTETPAWAGPAGNSPPPPAAYADFVRRLAGYFRGRVTAYEIWNEPNEDHFWQGPATPAAYAALLKPAYAAVKAADPGAKVVTGGLVANDYRFVDGLYDAGARGSFDYLGLHTDSACNLTDPRNALRDADGRISRWSFTGYREVRATMLDHGDDKPIWMTELGWSVTSANCPHRPADPGGLSAATQAAYLSNAYACLAADPYVEVGTWFSLQDFGAADIVGYRYGLYDWTGAARPALSAFRAAANAAPDPSCGLPVDRGAADIAIAWPADGKNVSGDLRYNLSASDAQGIRTLALYVDGRLIRITAKSSLKGVWTGWRKLPYGPHTVSVKAVDNALNAATRNVTVNRVRYGDGEQIRTRIGVGVYGTAKQRLVAGRLYTKPAVARAHVRGRLLVAFERQGGRKWRPVGAASAGSVSNFVKVRRNFKPGRYRAVISFRGYKSFRPTVTRRSFTVR